MHYLHACAVKDRVIANGMDNKTTKKHFISSHFFGKKDAENLALRDQGLCVAAHLFGEAINTESDLVGENLATKGDELYFLDLPIYNKLNIS